MKIVVIGLGSMGKRRIRHIRDMYPEYEVLGVDQRDDRRFEASTLYDIETFPGLSNIPLGVDCAFVCTSPLSHSEIIRDCLLKNINVFSEINLVSEGYENNIALAKKNNLELFLSSTFLYRDETNYIKSFVSTEKKWNYVYHVGQYLPDWHPWESYNDFFVANNKTNGCRELLAIELPWLISSFGAVKSFNVISDTMSKLNIDYSDNYMIQLEHDNGNKGSLIIDVVSPCPVRKFEAYAEHSYISWGGTPDSLSVFDNNKKILETKLVTEIVDHCEGYVSFVVENAYREEIRSFFDILNGVGNHKYSFENDLEVLKLIDDIGA